MRKRFIAIVMTICLCITLIPAVLAQAADGPTPQQVQETIMALKDKDEFKQGTPWDNSSPTYWWHGGPIGEGFAGGVGCAGFAMKVSDVAFGALPARTVWNGDFTFADVRPGDILRINNNTHSVVIVEVTDDGVTIVEGNMHLNGGPGIIYWGRTMTKAEVEAADYLATRYPVASAQEPSQPTPTAKPTPSATPSQPTPTPSVTPSAPSDWSGVKGDLVGAGKVTLPSLIQVAKHVTGSRELKPEQLVIVDMNDDGRITVSDLVAMAKQLTFG